MSRPRNRPATVAGVGVWLVRPKVRQLSRIGRWLEAGECAIGWREIGPVEPGTPRDEIRSRLEVAYRGRSPGTIAAWVGNVDRFVNQVSVGDLVVSPDGRDLHVGRIGSRPWFEAGDDEAHRRRVLWVDPTEPVDRREVSPRLARSLTTLLTVADLSRHAEEIAGRAGLPPPALRPAPGDGTGADAASLPWAHPRGGDHTRERT